MITNPECRLITLTGTGGVGKTRLALKVGEENQARYPHGVWLVELSTLLQEHLVTERTAAVFNLLGNENRDPMRALKDFLKVSKLLLILDSCEHLINVCAKMVEYLLQNCPQLQIIATSQEALAIPGEIIYVVPPFDIQDLGKHPDLNQVIANDAVQLFVHRATLVKPTFQISHGNQEAVTYICNRLDGIPLALELAAARL
jgi:non-specific serine/threonine protein kinase